MPEEKMMTGKEVIEMFKTQSIPFFVTQIMDNRYPIEIATELVIGAIYRAAPDVDCFMLAVTNNIELRETIKANILMRDN